MLFRFGIAGGYWAEVELSGRGFNPDRLKNPNPRHPRNSAAIPRAENYAVELRGISDAFTPENPLNSTPEQHGSARNCGLFFREKTPEFAIPPPNIVN